jgi:hypothetical protein
MHIICQDESVNDDIVVTVDMKRRKCVEDIWIAITRVGRMCFPHTRCVGKERRMSLL